jgi:hypothetical protein
MGALRTCLIALCVCVVVVVVVVVGGGGGGRQPSVVRVASPALHRTVPGLRQRFVRISGHHGPKHGPCQGVAPCAYVGACRKLPPRRCVWVRMFCVCCSVGFWATKHSLTNSLSHTRTHSLSHTHTHSVSLTFTC